MSYADLPHETLAELKHIFLEEIAEKGTPLHPRMEAVFERLGV